MRQRHAPELRPARLHCFFQILIPLLLGVSFLTGGLLWWGDSIYREELRAPPWLHPARVLHGALYPFLCVLFGVLLAQHIRQGWRLKANRASGLLMEIIMALQILTALGLYYLGNEAWRERCLWTHRLTGALFPVALAAHWIQARYWVRQRAAPPPS